MNSDRGPGSGPGPDVTMTVDVNQGTHFYPLLTTFSSSDLPASALFAHHNSACLPGAIGSHVFLLGTQGCLPHTCVWVSLPHSVCHGV